MNGAKVVSSNQAPTIVQAIFWGGLVSGIPDEGVIAYGAQGLNPIQVL
jgi:hypothetical protein